MRNIILVFAITFAISNLNAQYLEPAGESFLTIQYDAAGNQIFRKLCINCLVGTRDKKAKPDSAKTADDVAYLDDLKYYPNPVSEDLHLEWKIEKENFVETLYVFTNNGQLLSQKSIANDASQITVPFQTLSSGIYHVVLVYNSGEKKSVKIVKK